MAKGMHFYTLAIWLLMTIGTLTVCARYDMPICVDDSEENCKFGTYKDICNNDRCYKGPGEECNKRDPSKKCHPSLECGCDQCIGCYRQDIFSYPICNLTICPSNNLFRNMIKRYELNVRNRKM